MDKILKSKDENFTDSWVFYVSHVLEFFKNISQREFSSVLLTKANKTSFLRTECFRFQRYAYEKKGVLLGEFNREYGGSITLKNL